MTERVMAVKNFSESALHYQKLIDSMGDPIHIIDTEYRIILTNKALIRWVTRLGLEASLIGKKLKDVFPFLPEMVYEEYEQVLRSEETLVTNEKTELSGKVVFTETRKIPVYIENDVRMIMTIIHDVSSLKEAIREIQLGGEMDRVLLDALPCAVFATDLDGRMIMANSQALLLLGAEAETDILGQSSFDWITPDYQQLALDNLIKTAELGQNVNQHYVLYRRDGTEFPAVMDASLLRKSDGQPEGFIAIVRDVTNEVNHRAELKHKQEFFQRLYKSAPVGLAEIRLSDWRCVACNNEFADILGFDTTELLDAGYAFGPSDSGLSPEIRAEIKKSLRSVGIVNREINIKRRDGSEIQVRVIIKVNDDKTMVNIVVLQISDFG